eukprot:GHVU01186116.1.p1 GENE.GHVU01186116.1~~GHVU01186116.1.p1  ORF type:complete len:183 (-),score=16.04 GHVU01186116.1:54-602(-)
MSSQFPLSGIATPGEIQTDFGLTKQNMPQQLPASKQRRGKRQHNLTFQRFLAFGMNVTSTPVPLLNNTQHCDTILISVPGTQTNPIFVGSQNVTSGFSGFTIDIGRALKLRAENVRYMEEITTYLEKLLCAMNGAQPSLNIDPFQTSQYSRLVLDAHDFYLAAGAGNTVRADIMIFYTPGRQ